MQTKLPPAAGKLGGSNWTSLISIGDEDVAAFSPPTVYSMFEMIYSAKGEYRRTHVL